MRADMSHRASITIQSFYTTSVVPEENRADLLSRFDFIYGLVEREDYWACEQAQTTLHTGANKTLIFGRQEIALHRLHESCAAHMSLPI